MPRRSTRRAATRRRSVARGAAGSIRHEQERVIVALARGEALAKGDLAQAFHEIVRAAATAARTRRVGIWRYGEGRHLLECVEQYDLGRRRFSRGEKLTAAEYPAYFAALDSEVVVAATDAQTDRRTRELTESYLRRHDIVSMLDAPILVGGRLWGVLCHEAVAPRRHWSTGDKLFARALADTVALAIESAERRDAVHFSATLLRIGYDLMSSADHTHMLERLCQLIVEALPCDFSRTLFVDDDGRTLRLAASHGHTPEEKEFLNRVEVAASDIAAITARLDKEELILGSPYPKEVERFGWKAAMVLALRHGGQVVGAQTVGRRSGQPFSPTEQRLARGIAQIASLSLQNLLLVSRLERANRVKSDFISMMSHELRTPLNIILGYTGMLSEQVYGPLSDEQADILRRIERGAQSLLDLITTTLDLNRLERGDVSVQVAEVDLRSLVAGVEAQSRALHERREVAFMCELPADLPPLQTDGGKLRVILANLVTNAFRFTERGEIRVGVRPMDRRLEITVADTGAGIPAAEHATIFEAFRQGPGNEGRAHGGVGLGLYIVRRLLDLLHGSIEVESEVGRGSTFRVWLPLDPAAHRQMAPSAPPRRAAALASTAAARLGRRR
jgi:signal transduction histidine kinase